MLNIKLPKDYGFWGLVGAGALLVILLAFSLFAQYRAQTFKVVTQVKLAEAEFSKTLALQNSRDILTSQYTAYSGFFINDKREPRQHIELLLRELESAARDAGVVVLNLSPQGTSGAASQPREFKADLRLEGSRDQVFVFLSNVEKSRALLRVLKISLSPKDEEGRVLKADMVVVLSGE